MNIKCAVFHKSVSYILVCLLIILICVFILGTHCEVQAGLELHITLPRPSSAGTAGECHHHAMLSCHSRLSHHSLT